MEYLRALRRRWQVIAGAAIVGLIVGALLTRTGNFTEAAGRDGPWTATTSLLSAPPESSDPTTAAAASTFDSLSTAAELVTVGPVPERVAKVLGGEDPDRLTQDVEATPDEQTGFLYIAATADRQGRAITLANTFAEQLTGYLEATAEAETDQKQEVLRRQRALKREELAALDRRIAGAGEERANTLRTERNGIEADIRELSDELTALALAPAAAPLTIIDAADQVEPAPDGFLLPRDPLILVPLTGVIAGLAAAGLVLLWDGLDSSIRTKQEAERHFSLPVLAEIPFISRRRRSEELTPQPGGVSGDAFRLLGVSVTSPSLQPGEAGPDVDRRPLPTVAMTPPALTAALKRDPMDKLAVTYVEIGTALLGDAFRLLGMDVGQGELPAHAEGSARATRLIEAPAQTILVTSPGASDGKTTVVAKLATACAEGGKSVIVLSCDFRRPHIHTLFGFSNKRGLSDILQAPNGATGLDGYLLRPGSDDMALLPSGPTPERPRELLASERMRGLLDEARRRADVVLIDTTPVLAPGDAASLIAHVDAVLVVSRAGRTTVELAERTKEILNRLGAPSIGVVLNGARDPLPRYDYSRER
jgi:capsular exopolysaccharide synthesis family protein